MSRKLKQNAKQIAVPKMLNYDDAVEKETNDYRNTNGYIIHPARIIMTAPSGSGKTNTILNLLFTQGLNMNWDKLYVIARVIDEDKYKYINMRCKELEKAFEEVNDEKHVFLEKFSNELLDVPKLEELDPKFQNLVIIDDFGNTPWRELEKHGVYDLFTMGRKFNTTTIFIAHQYNGSMGIPKKIRLNANYAFIYKLPSSREVSNLYQEFSNGIEKEQFKKIYYETVNKPYNFLLVDNKSNPPKFRSGLTEVISFEEAASQSDQSSDDGSFEASGRGTIELTSAELEGLLAPSAGLLSES